MRPLCMQADVIANPFYVRGQAPGVAAAAVGALRNKRLDMKV